MNLVVRNHELFWLIKWLDRDIDWPAYQIKDSTFWNFKIEKSWQTSMLEANEFGGL